MKFKGQRFHAESNNLNELKVTLKAALKTLGYVYKPKDECGAEKESVEDGEVALIASYRTEGNRLILNSRCKSKMGQCAENYKYFGCKLKSDQIYPMVRALVQGIYKKTYIEDDVLDTEDSLLWTITTACCIEEDGDIIAVIVSKIKQ